MPSILGNTGTSVYLLDFNQGCTLRSFTLVNKSDNAVKANLAITREGVNYNIIPKDTTINVYEMYSSDIPRQLNANDRAHLAVTGGNVDYNLSIVL